MLRDEGSQIPPTSVSPGLHQPEAGHHRVVWWDPKALELDVQESVGLRQQKILQADDGSVQSDAGIRAHDRWQEDRTRTRESGSVHTVRVVTATGLAVLQREQSESAVVADDVTIESIDVAFGRPTGRRFGSLVHALLAVADFEAGPEELRHILDAQKRSLGATDEEAEAAFMTVVGALEHPLIRRAAAASRKGECRRETSLTLKLDDGTLVEGFADVAFLETEPAPAWTVVDFKTDAEIAGRLEDYRRQVAIYARGVSEATGVPTRGVLLRL
jgi:ATP-dependent exoDNAse (exonuclease V) beta subunit